MGWRGAVSAPTLVLCMAGHYTRFRDAGYRGPKFLLTVRTETILSRIVRALDRSMEAGADLRIARAEMQDTIVLGTPSEYEAYVSEHGR